MDVRDEKRRQAASEEAPAETAPDYEAPETGAGDEESEALIEQFLAETAGEVVREPGEEGAPAWPEALPEGHRAGFVALIGRPNVGKSTLINALIGHKVTIVSSKPQTTRSRIMGILTAPAYQLIFVDTPGIHKRPPHQINKMMIAEAVAAIPDADTILFVVDVAVAPRDEDEMIARILREKAEARPVMLVLNKVDRVDPKTLDDRRQAYEALLPGAAEVIAVSALEETNVDQLEDAILNYVPEGPRYYPGDQITDQTEHQIAAELIREAVFRLTYREIPHAAAVLIEDYHERENGVLYIAARIWVERESQKPIVIGKGGSLLKRIGTEARHELERFIGGQVYLDLWVKVKPRWRDEMARLRELGY
ncbi:MAG: GTPase Era [Anaerolineae bacterium]|nr:GTPase Era [Anaerolineae bacterium]